MSIKHMFTKEEHWKNALCECALTVKYHLLFFHTHLVVYEFTVFVTVDFLIVLEDAVAGTSTHEVVVTLTRRKTAAHGCSRLATTLTALAK